MPLWIQDPAAWIVGAGARILASSTPMAFPSKSSSQRVGGRPLKCSRYLCRSCNFVERLSTSRNNSELSHALRVHNFLASGAVEIRRQMAQCCG